MLCSRKFDILEIIGVLYKLRLGNIEENMRFII